ncbi:DNA mismatch repair protein MutL, partial [Streptococcus suis]
MSHPTADSAHGHQVDANGAVIEMEEPESRPVGTQITDSDLFYNNPDRLKYVLSQQAEVSHLVDVLNRVRQAHTEMA